MKTLKIFVSQPMSGKTLEEIERARSFLNSEDVQANIVMSWNEIVNFGDILNGCEEAEGPIEIVDQIHEPDLEYPVQMLGRSIAMMAGCDMVIFISQWKEAKGCRIERMICEEYGIPAFEYFDGGLSIAEDTYEMNSYIAGVSDGETAAKERFMACLEGFVESCRYDSNDVIRGGND